MPRRPRGRSRPCSSSQSSTRAARQRLVVGVDPVRVQREQLRGLDQTRRGCRPRGRACATPGRCPITSPSSEPPPFRRESMSENTLTMRMPCAREMRSQAVSMARKWRGLPWKFETITLRKPWIASERPMSSRNAIVVDGRNATVPGCGTPSVAAHMNGSLQERARAMALGQEAQRALGQPLAFQRSRRRAAGAARAPPSASRSRTPPHVRGRSRRTASWSASPSGSSSGSSGLPSRALYATAGPRRSSTTRGRMAR